MAIIVRDKGFYKNLLALALPIMLQSLISIGINFTDNLMVGTLGENAIAGVYLGGQIQSFLSMLVAGIEGAIMVLASQYWGRRDILSIKKIIAIGSQLSLALGILFFLASALFAEPILRLFTPEQGVIGEGAAYLRIISFSFLTFSVSQVLISSMRAVETVRLGLFISVISFITNILFNWMFIFGIPAIGLPAMGAQGAALATLLSRIIEMCVMLVFVFKVDQKLSMTIKDFLHMDSVLLKDFIKYGLPVVGGSFVWSINIMAQSAIIGRLSAEAIAAVSIANMLFSLLYMGIQGMCSAVSIITGRTVGAGQFETMKTYAKTIQIMFLVLGIVAGAAIYASKELFLGLYDISAETHEIARQFLTVLSVTIVGSSYQAASLAGLVKAGGDTGFVFKNDTIFVFLVVLPSAIIALNVFHAPAWVVFACLKSDQILKCFVAVVKINRFKWMKNLTRDFDKAPAPQET